MDNRLTIIGLVARAMRGWVAAIESDEDSDAPSACSGGAYSVFYVDARWPNQIQMRGAEADRCELWIEPSDVRAGPGGPELLVDVKIAHRRDGEPTVTEFQIALTEELKPLMH